MKRDRVARGDRLVVVGVVRRVGRLGVDLAGVRVHDDGRDALGPVGDPGREELLLDLQLEAGVDRQAQVRAGHARPATTVASSSIGLAARVALGDDDPRLAGERRLVGLLDAVLAAALAVDEAEQVRGEGRARAAADLRVDPLGLGLERQAEDALGRRCAARIWSATSRSRPWRRMTYLRGAGRAGRAGRSLSASSSPRIRVSSVTVAVRCSGVSWSGAATRRSRWTVVARTTVPVRS